VIIKRRKDLFCGWATVCEHWDDIAFMMVVTFQAINTDCDLDIRILFAACGMTYRDLAINACQWTGRAPALWRRDDITFMSIVTI
jgi:hypothetical protein